MLISQGVLIIFICHIATMDIITPFYLLEISLALFESFFHSLSHTHRIFHL